VGSEISTMTTTMRFLRGENQRLQQLNEELQEENSYLRECFKSLRGLQRAVSRLDAHVQLKALLDRIIYEALRIVDAAEGSLSLIDESKQELVFVVVRGTLCEQLQGHRIPLRDGIVGWVIAHGEPEIVNDISQDDRFSPLVDVTFDFRTRSLISVPLISRGKVLGAIEVVNKFSGRPFDEKDLEMLSMLALIAARAIDLAGFKGRN